MSPWWLLLPLASAWALTGLLRRYALARSLMDIPNARSSHEKPTPRGGGVAIVIAVLAGLPFLGMAEDVSTPVLMAVGGAGGLVALIGFLDDHGDVAPRWRLLAHFAAAGWALAWLGGLAPFSLPGGVVDLGWFGHMLAALYLVWMLNLYNFMDGIDGIASIETITVCLAGILLLLMCAPDALALAWLPALLAAAVAGFLVWNFPPAKIFMGDAGSSFLGMVLGVLGLALAWADPQLLWSWAILLGVFIVDATVTLIRRLLSGEKVYEAHRSHAYQYASRRCGAHRPVSLAVGLINTLWLCPIALLVGAGWLNGVLGVVVAYAPLVWLAFYYKAGAGRLQG